MRVSYKNTLVEDTSYIDKTTFSHSSQDADNSMGVNKQYVPVDWNAVYKKCKSKIQKGRELDLAETLDYAYIENMRSKRVGLKQPLNVLVQGDPGGGKTSIIESWAEQRNISYLKITGAQLTASMIRGLPFREEINKALTDDEIKNSSMSDEGKQKVRSVVRYLRSTAFDVLDEHPNTILFIDEINRSDVEAEAGILTLIQSHAVPSDELASASESTGERIFNNFLMTVAAENPLGDADPWTTGMHPLTDALKNRFVTVKWESTPESLRKFFGDTYRSVLDVCEDAVKDAKDASSREQAKDDLEVWQHRKDIADTLLAKPGFSFRDKDGKQFPHYSAEYGETQTFSSRSLTIALNLCDGEIGDIQGQPISLMNRNGQDVDVYKYSPMSFLDCLDKAAGSFAAKEVYELLQEDIENEQQNNGAANNYKNTVYQAVLAWAQQKGLNI